MLDEETTMNEGSQSVNKLLSPTLPHLINGAELISADKKLTPQEIKNKLPLETEGQKTNAPDYLRDNLKSVLTLQEITDLGLQADKPLTNHDQIKIAGYLLDKIANEPTIAGDIKKKLTALEAHINLPEIIASLQVIGIEAAQREFFATQTTTSKETVSFQPTDETFGAGSRRQLYTEMGGFGDEVILEGDSMKALTKVGENIVVEPTVEMDLRLAQVLFNTALPPEYVVQVARLQQEIKSEIDPAKKIQLAHDTTLLRQKLYKSIMVAYNTKPEKSEIKIEDSEKVEIENIAGQVRKRMVDVEENGTKLQNMSLTEANKTSFNEIMTHLDVSNEGKALFTGFNEFIMNVHAGSKLNDVTHDFFQNPAFANLTPENKSILEKILADRVRTDMSIGGIESYYQKYNAGIKTENIGLSLFLSMGVKGTELLYRRSLGEKIIKTTEEPPTTDLPDWLKPEIPLLKMKQNSQMTDILDRLKKESEGSKITIYQGNRDKTVVLNEGITGKDDVHQEYAVPYKMRLGEQHLQLPLAADDKDPTRVKILEDVTKPEADNAFVVKQINTRLYLKIGEKGKKHDVPLGKLEENPFVIALNEQVAVEVRGFNPATREIILHKIKGSKELWDEQEKSLTTEPPITLPQRSVRTEAKNEEPSLPLSNEIQGMLVDNTVTDFANEINDGKIINLSPESVFNQGLRERRKTLDEEHWLIMKKDLVEIASHPEYTKQLDRQQLAELFETIEKEIEATPPTEADATITAPEEKRSRISRITSGLSKHFTWRNKKIRTALSLASLLTLGTVAEANFSSLSTLVTPSNNTAVAATVVPAADNIPVDTVPETSQKLEKGSIVADQIAPLFTEIVEKDRLEKDSRDLERSKRVDSKLNENLINFVIIGTGNERDWGERNADAIVVASYDTQANEFSLASLHRDAQAPEIFREAQKQGKPVQWYETEIMRAMNIGGMNLLEEIIEDTTKLSIDFHIELKHEALVTFIDKMFGKIKINVPADIKEDTKYNIRGFEAGIQEMDGKTALAYAITRESSSLERRNSAQEQVIEVAMGELLNRLKTGNVLEKIDMLIKLKSTFEQMQRDGTLDTNIPINEIMSKLIGKIPSMAGAAIGGQDVFKPPEIKKMVIEENGLVKRLPPGETGPRRALEAYVNQATGNQTEIDLTNPNNLTTENLVNHYYKSIRDTFGSFFQN